MTKSLSLKLLLVFIISFAEFWRTSVFCFNIESRDPIVKKAPEDQKDSYFGFSVALHQTKAHSNSLRDNWLLVGAPLGKNLQPGTNASGALFKCPIREDNCIQVETDGQRLGDFDYNDNDNEVKELEAPGVDEIKNGQWLGVSVRSQKPGGLVMVCAHRYIQSSDLSKYHYGQGLCYLLNSTLYAFETLQYCKGLPKEKLHQQYGFCQIGTSISFVGDDFALIGSPGPYTWRGTIFGQVVVGDFLTMDTTIYKGPLNDNPEPIHKYSYLGMSVGAGYILSKSEYTYVSGAPRSQMIGQVYLFSRRERQEEFNITFIITGEQFASSFGYELLVVDVNNDGFDDLLVAAPFYYNDNKGGAVYIYYNLRNCNSAVNCQYDSVLYGKEQSRFGFALTSIGDINKDGYNDVAIGAPYESGVGTVYIYLGSAQGLSEEPSQVMFFRNLRTFGYSLSGGLDMDNNGYPDLLVGAYESERALLFLTRPIIDTRIHVSSNDMLRIDASKKGCAADPRNVNNTCFSIRSCFRVLGEPRITKEFSVIYSISEMSKFSRIWFQNKQHADKRSNENKDYITVDSYSKNYCQDEVVYIKEGVSDILTPIKFKVQYTLENDTTHTPILNKSSIHEFEATFQKDCGDDDICNSYLNLEAWTNMEKNDKNEYKVTSLNEEFILETNITNAGESAYEAKLFVFHPKALSYINFKSEKNPQIKCSVRNDSLVICDLGNPFQGNANAILKLRFEIVKTTKEQKLDIRLKVNSTSHETSRNTEVNLVAILQKFAEFSITGRGTTNLFFGGNVVGESAMKHLEDIGARVVHRYFIDNRGQWDLPNLKVQIQWPYQVRPAKEEYEGKWLLYLESVPVIKGAAIGLCTVENNDTVVNPLKLELALPDEPEDLILPPGNSFEKDDKLLNSTKNRRKRDTTDVPESQELVSSKIKRRIIYMNCSETARCANIECYIGGLKKHNQAFIEIRSRIWNSTLVEDYSDVDWVDIKSEAVVEIDKKIWNTRSEQQFNSYAKTLIYPSAISPYSVINWWIIGVAIIAGLLLLIVLVVILYRCGFFKRKRVTKDPTLSGNLLSKDENDSLLKQ